MKAERFALWVFERIVDGVDQFSAEELLDEMERRGLVAAESHSEEGVPGVFVSLFWKESNHE